MALAASLAGTGWGNDGLTIPEPLDDGPAPGRREVERDRKDEEEQPQEVADPDLHELQMQQALAEEEVQLQRALAESLAGLPVKREAFLQSAEGTSAAAA